MHNGYWVVWLVLWLAPSAWSQVDDVPKTPVGWELRARASKGEARFRPAERATGELLEVTYFSRSLIENYAIDRWLGYRLVSEDPPRGKALLDWKIQKMTGNLAMATREFETLDGERGLQVATGVCVDSQWARLAIANYLPAKLSEDKRYKDAATGLLTGLFGVEKSCAEREGRGVKLEPTPPKVSELKAGGDIQPGRYVGNGVTRGDNDIRARYDLWIFANGEYEFSEGTDHGQTGWVTYSPATGRLNLRGDLYNSLLDPEEDFCVYGVDKKGRPLIYSENDWGLGVTMARLHRVGDVDKPSPQARKRQEEIAALEARRYKFRTEPGQGVRPGELLGVLYAVEAKVQFTDNHVDEYPYLLFQDGRVMDGMPVPPEELDMPTSRAREGDRWGWWKKVDDQYHFAWPSRPNEFAAPRGQLYPARPVPKGTSLNGKYGAASSWAQPVMAAGGASFWGVIFTDNSRFQTYSNGISGAGGVPGFDVLATAVWNDEGSSSSASGMGVVTYVQRSSGKTESDRSGTYAFDGFCLILHYDNGRIVRESTFFGNLEDEKSIWFQGHILRLEERK